MGRMRQPYMSRYVEMVRPWCHFPGDGDDDRLPHRHERQLPSTVENRGLLSLRLVTTFLDGHGMGRLHLLQAAVAGVETIEKATDHADEFQEADMASEEKGFVCCEPRRHVVRAFRVTPDLTGLDKILRLTGAVEQGIVIGAENISHIVANIRRNGEQIDDRANLGIEIAQVQGPMAGLDELCHQQELMSLYLIQKGVEVPQTIENILGTYIR